MQSHIRRAPDVGVSVAMCAEEEITQLHAIISQIISQGVCTGEEDFLMEDFTAWSFKRKYLWQETLG